MNGTQSSAFSLGALATSAAKFIAPNSLQYNEHEFQRSPKDAQDAAREAARLVQPGDLIFMTTSGLVYSLGRSLTDNAYDHVVVVLDECTVLHVGMPSVKLMPLERLLLPQRQPVVQRVQMLKEELQLFLRCARQLVGCKYDGARAYKLMLRLILKRMFGIAPLPRLPLDVKSNAWICSDSIIVLLAGCCKRFRESLMKAKQETKLDIFTLGSASLADFERLHRVQPDIISRVPLPVVNYTLVPRKCSWQAYIPEVIRFAQSVHDRNWPLLAPRIFSEVRAIAASLPPKSWLLEEKVQVLGYVVVLLFLLRRGITVKRVLMRAIEVLMLRYVAHHVVLYVPSFSAFGTAKL
ncbi:putative papain-like cysteine peptidase superfamily [Plasmopara halstedii]